MSGSSPSGSTTFRSGIPTSARSSAPPSLLRRKSLWVTVVVLAAAAGVGAAWWSMTRPNDKGSNGSTGVVTRGPMTISITEQGEVEADKRRVISNELQWPVIIKQVVPEGTTVQAGEVIIEFECKELIDAITQQRLTVDSAQNEYTTAHENLTLKKKETDNLVRKAEQAVTDAEDDQRRYVEGDWPVKQADAESAISVARQDLKLTQEKLDFKLKVNKDPTLKSPYSANEIQADELGVERLRQGLQTAKNNQEILLKYTHPRDVRKLEIAVEDTKLALERTRLQAKTDYMLAEAQDRMKKAALDMHTERLKDYLDQEKKLVVKAEKPGLVVYDTGPGRRRDPNAPTVQVSEKITPRQQLMIIPDMSTLQVKTKVFEAVVDQVTPGVEGMIRLDAKADQLLTGRVSRVAVLPDTQNWLNPDIKTFNVVVKFDDPPEGLKPGMTAQVELVLARLDDVLSAPVAAVFVEQESTFCWRQVGGNVECVPVKVGRTSPQRVEICAGLEVGDVLLLSPPPGVTSGSKKSQAAETQPSRRGPESRPAVAPNGGGDGEPQTQPRRSRPPRERPRSMPAAGGAGAPSVTGTGVLVQ